MPQQGEGLTTLGLLRVMGHPDFYFFEWVYLVFIRRCLVDDWSRLMRGVDRQALELWRIIFETLELDRKACVDIVLLMHSGVVGRAKANEVLWEILSYWALKPEYRDLSHKVSALVGHARMSFDRPPGWHPDMQFWDWGRLTAPQHVWWSPTQVIEHAFAFLNAQGDPQPPPHCWAEPWWM